MLVSSIGYIVFRKVVNESKRSVVYGLIDHAHVIGVKHPMDETIDLPVSHELGSLFDNNMIHLFIRVSLIRANAWVAVF